MKYTTLEEAKNRLLSNTEITDTCWIWKGSKVTKGYGKLKLTNFLGSEKREDWLTHRLSYLVFKGDIPANFFVCHTCDIRDCINPEHLFLGTAQDNVDDMIAKNRKVINLDSLYGNNRSGKKVLADGVEYVSYVAAGKALGVSDNAIRKRIKNNWPGYAKLH